MKTYNNSVSLRNDGVDPSTSEKDLNAGVGINVTVRVASTPVAGQGALASIFNISDDAIGNPLQTDNQGNYNFKAPDGVYDIVIAEGTADEKILSSEEIIELTYTLKNGVIVFSTFALLDAYTPVNVDEQRASYKVTNDPDGSLNGYYSWVSGSEYSKDADLVVNVIDENNTSDAVSGSAVSKYTFNVVNTATISDGEFSGLMSKVNIGLGAYNSAGTTIANSDYARTPSSTGSFKYTEGLEYYFTGEIDNAAYSAIVYRDISGNVLGSDLSGIGIYDRVKINPPENTYWIASCSLNTNLPELEERSEFNTADKSLDNYNSLDSALSGELIKDNSITYQSGAIKSTYDTVGMTESNAIYFRGSVTSSTNMIKINHDNDYFYTGSINNEGYAGILYLDSSLNFIKVQCSDVSNYLEYKLLIPSNAAYISSCSSVSEPVIEYRTKSNIYSERLIKSIPLERTSGAITTAFGYITKTGTTASSSSHRRTSATGSASMFTVIDDSHLYYTGKVDLSNMAGVLYFDENTNLISFEAGDIETYINFKLTVPQNTKFIAMSSAGDDPLISYDRVYDLNTGNTVHVNSRATGRIEDGSITNPFRTITSAIKSVLSSARISVDFGFYRETLPLADLKSGKYEIVAKHPNTVRVMGSDKLPAFTDNTNNVWKVAFTGVIPDFPRLGGKLIFEDFNPSKIITDNPHPLQRNLTHRLPFTPIEPRASLAEVEAEAGTYYHDGADIYLHASNSSNPNTNGFSYEVIVREANTFVDIDDQKESVDLKLQGIQFVFNGGFVADGFNKMTRYNCSCLASHGNGAFMNNTGYIETWFEEAAFCEIDGENSHFNVYSNFITGSDNRANYPTVAHNYLWTHDNGDDGESSHENHNVVMNNCLMEWNGDSGSRPASDATYNYNNCHARKNGWEISNFWTNEVTSGGEGFAGVGVRQNTNRQGNRITINNCISEENSIGYASEDSANCFVEVVNSTSRNNVSAEFLANNGANLLVRNCRATNSNTAKLKVTTTGGVITVINDDILS